ncbi:MAG: hypothetical protein ACRD8O_06945 [Bryobacteraceae bacterium]
MLRNLFRFLVAISVVVLLRYLVAAVSRAFSRNSEESGVARSTQTSSVSELQRDPVCGTFVAPAASVKKIVEGKEVHFCSAACRDKFRVA